MNHKIKTSRDGLNRYEKDNKSEPIFFDHELIAESTSGEESNSKSDAFIVDWQMNNPKQKTNTNG